MIYTPQKEPTKAMILITAIVCIGVFGGFFIHRFFMLFALIYWIQMTLVISYLQFKKKSKHKWDNITEILLQPQVRFFLFEFLAVIGILSIVRFQNLNIGALALLAWFAFSINFYFHYKQFRRYGLIIGIS